MPDNSGGAQPPKQDGQTQGGNMPRVLVVDDDPMVCMAIEIYLERHSFQVTIADGGEAGLQALDGTAFDLMIVDIFMPHMRGFESIRICMMGAIDSPADRDVRLRLCKSRYARAGDFLWRTALSNLGPRAARVSRSCRWRC